VCVCVCVCLRERACVRACVRYMLSLCSVLIYPDNHLLLDHRLVQFCLNCVLMTFDLVLQSAKCLDHRYLVLKIAIQTCKHPALYHLLNLDHYSDQ